MNAAELPNWLSTFTADTQVASTVRARGRLDLFTIDLRGTMDVLILGGCTEITLDLAEVTTIDKAGVRLLLEVHSSLLTKSGALCVNNAAPAVSDALAAGQTLIRPAARIMAH